jgi:hypothetical protein
MANWYYYNKMGEKISVADKELNRLVRDGEIIPDTLIEDPNGRSKFAKDIKGLTFPDTLAVAKKAVVVPVAVESGEYALAAPLPDPKPPTTPPVNQTMPQRKSESANVPTPLIGEKIKRQNNVGAGTVPSVKSNSSVPIEGTLTADAQKPKKGLWKVLWQGTGTTGRDLCNVAREEAGNVRPLLTTLFIVVFVLFMGFYTCRFIVEQLGKKHEQKQIDELQMIAEQEANQDLPVSLQPSSEQPASWVNPWADADTPRPEVPPQPVAPPSQSPERRSDGATERPAPWANPWAGASVPEQ